MNLIDIGANLARHLERNHHVKIIERDADRAETIAEHLKNGSTLDEVLIVAPDPREFEPFKAKIDEGASNA